MFALDKYARTPIYEQMVQQVVLRILEGELGELDPLPSVRNLAVSLGINPNTLQKAYAQLEQRGLCVAVPGSGRFVAKGARGRILAEKRGQIEGLRHLAQELQMAGIPLAEVLACVTDAYEQKGESEG